MDKKVGNTPWTRQEIIKIIIYILLFSLVVVLISAVFNHFFHPERNDTVRNLLQYENYGFAIFLGFVVIASIFVPLPTLPFDVVMLELANPWTVVFLRTLGAVIGGSVSYYLSRTYGMPLIRKWFSKNNVLFIESILGKVTWKTFFWITMFPAVNSELMAYVGGLSKIRYSWIMLIVAIGIGYRVIFVLFVLDYSRYVFYWVGNLF